MVTLSSAIKNVFGTARKSNHSDGRVVKGQCAAAAPGGRHAPLRARPQGPPRPAPRSPRGAATPRSALAYIPGMTGDAVGLIAATTLASGVEFVEALTIVLAIGTTRGWRSTWAGVGAALAALAVVTAVAGYALQS